MEELLSAIKLLDKDVAEALTRLSIEEKSTERDQLQRKMGQPDYWQVTDNTVAQRESKLASDLETLVLPWTKLSNETKELLEFAELGDGSMTEDLTERLGLSAKAYEALRSDLRFSGEHDHSSVVMNIQAGAGGNDAQDWAQMLQRMYVRWAENNDMNITILSESSGEEAGIKSASMQIEGKFAFGQLKGEHGVHRLVRLSPFNSANSRETSFAMVEVIPVIDSPEDLEIDESDLRVDVYRAGGRGGQSVNTTDSAVRITHVPTGVVVSIQNERSQLQNKETAMKVLKSKLVSLAEEQHQEKLSDLKGPNQEAAWGNQIRSYVLHPYTMVKDGRSNYSSSNVQDVLDGKLNELIDAYLDATLGE